MHEIEDLVEDTVRLVPTSPRPAEEKRRLIFHLYRSQARFDTSVATGRLQDELQLPGSFLQESDEKIPVLPLAATIMRYAGERGDRQLLHQWLAAIAEALTDLEIDN